MEYRQTDGKTRRVHKQYVDVVARILAGGQVVEREFLHTDSYST